MMTTTRPKCWLWLFLALVASFPAPCLAFSPPTLGIGALLFPIRNAVIRPVGEYYENEDLRDSIMDASDFFVDAFWASKMPKSMSSSFSFARKNARPQLTDNQRQSLQQSQTAEFNKRYGGNKNNRNRKLSDFLVCRNTATDEIMACAGVEMERIPATNLRSLTALAPAAPLMSNLAVGNDYRRRGLAERMVQAVEEHIRTEWKEYYDTTDDNDNDEQPLDACYLYVERQNIGAVKLYQKLGYRQVWIDNEATTLLPTEDGRLNTVSTQIICMRKQLKPRFLGIF